MKATAQHIHERGGQFVFPVKENRRALFDALDALAWQDVPVAHRSVDKGHGRLTARTIQVLPAPPDLPFPHGNQVFLIERYVSDLRGGPISAIAALGVASPKPDQASPADLAGYVRERWSIESPLDPRHPPPGGQIPDQNPIRTRNHGRAPQPGDRSPPTGWTHRYHRSHPMGSTPYEPALHHSRTYIMILERPWGRRWSKNLPIV